MHYENTILRTNMGVAPINSLRFGNIQQAVNFIIWCYNHKMDAYIQADVEPGFHNVWTDGHKTATAFHIYSQEK